MAGRRESGELAFLRGLRSRAGGGGRQVRLGIGDDCAVLRPKPGHDLLVTTDFSLEGRHFRREWHPGRSAGHRCLARGLSDLAAMGAEPMAAFLSLAVPERFRAKAAGRRWMDDFLSGLLDLSKKTSTPLAGGDTSASPGEGVLADILLVGSSPRGTELRRSGASVGDRIYVTGALGGASAELESLAAKPSEFRRTKEDALHPHLFPQPRLAVGGALRRRRIATSAIDVSDGLSVDLRHLCEESGTGAVLRSGEIPIHPLALSCEDPLGKALHGGEDYELLFTASPKTRVPRVIAGVAITRIGTIVAAEAGLVLRNTDGSEMELDAKGWEHRI